MEEKIEERRRRKKKKKKKKKNCQAHVTVLRTCSMSYGGLYKTIIFSLPISITLGQMLLGLTILVQGGVLGQNKQLFITVTLFIDFGYMVYLVIM